MNDNPNVPGTPGGGKRIAETGCGVFSGIVRCLVAPWLILAAILGIIVVGWIAALWIGASSPQPASKPAVSPASASNVTILSQTVTMCAYCGRKIREGPRKLRPASETGGLATVRKYEVCGNKRCQKAAVYRKKHPDWPQDVCYSVAGRKVQLGMTREQVEAAWGRPGDINRTVTAFGASEQWCYGDIGGTYLYFDDGILTSFQD